MLHADINITELSKRFGTSQPNMTKRLKRGKLTREEMEKIADILGCEYVSVFRFPDGKEY